MNERTTFLNVDLEVFSKTPLDELVVAFGQRVDVLHVGKWGRRYAAHLEVSGSGYRAQADRLIRRFVAMVEALPKSKRRLWDGAQSREFNLGIEAAVKSQLFELALSTETLEAVVSVNASIVITVYAPERLHIARTETRLKRLRPPNKAMEPTARASSRARRGSSPRRSAA